MLLLLFIYLITKKKKKMNNQKIIFNQLLAWFCALNLGDWITTAYNLEIYKKVEMNFFYNYFNFNIYSFWIWKLILCFIYLILFTIIYNFLEKKNSLNILRFYNIYILCINLYFIFLIYHNMSISVFKANL